jgi:hypothetical protein
MAFYYRPKSVTLTYNTGFQPLKKKQQIKNIKGATYEENQVVVAGHPDIKGDEARAIYNYAKSSGTPVEIKKQEVKHNTKKYTSYTVKPSSTYRVAERMKVAESLSGWSSGELLKGYRNTTKTVEDRSGREVYYDTSKTVPAETIFKADKKVLNPYNVQGVSARGGVGAGGYLVFRDEANVGLGGEKVSSKKVYTFRDSGVGRGVVNSFNKLIAEPVQGLGEVGVNLVSQTSGVPSLGVGAIDLVGGKKVRDNYVFKELSTVVRGEPLDLFMSRKSYRTGIITAATLPLFKFQSFRAVAGTLTIAEGIRSGVENPSAEGITEGVLTAGLGVAILPKNNAAVRSFNALFNPRYRTKAETGLVFVEDVTTPTKLSVLRGFEGKRVVTTHVTPSKLPREFVTVAKPEGAGVTRTRFQLFNFYKAAPVTGSYVAIPVKGYKTRGVLKSFTSENLFDVPRGTTYFLKGGKTVSPYVRETSTGQAYLAYLGIGEGRSSSSSKILFGVPRGRILVGKDFISPTPKNLRGIMNINSYQVQRSGSTFVPAENIAGGSIEGQFITPSRYGERGIEMGFWGANVYQQGNLPVETFGSLIRQYPKRRTFVYYDYRKPNLLTKGVEFFRGKSLDREGLTFKILSQPTTNYYKLDLIPSKTFKVKDVTKLKDVAKLDEVKYALELEKYSTARRVESPQSVFSSRGSGWLSSSRVSSGVSSSVFSSRVPSSSLSSSRVLSSSLSSSGVSSSVFSSRVPSSSLSSSRVSSGVSSSRVSSGVSSSLSSSLSSSWSSSGSSIISEKYSRSSKRKGKVKKGVFGVPEVSFGTEYFADVTASAFGEFGDVPKVGVGSGFVPRPIRRKK